MTISPATDSSARAAVLERLERFTTPEPNSGCWLYTGALSNGYGLIHAPGLGNRAHRVAYQLLVGPIPEGLHLDHLCRNRTCVNPSHLEPVTQVVNNRRGIGVPDDGSMCRRGHTRTVDNTSIRWRKNGRSYLHCRSCKRITDISRLGPKVRRGNESACKKGHPYTEENIYWRVGLKGNQWRQCKACALGNVRAYRSRTNAAIARATEASGE